MNIFISWSGESSKKIAITLKDWIPNVIQCVEPYVSSEDIDKGARWHMDISKQLDETSFGIICLTRENVSAPWINFEAGALGKSVENSRVCPLLFGLMPSDIQGPISGFQTTKADDQEDFFKLISSINSICPSPIKDERLEEIFNVWWPMLSNKMNALLEEASKESQQDKPRTKAQQSALLNDKTVMILEEILEMSRGNYQLLRDPSNLLPEGYVRSVMKVHRDSKGLPDEILMSVVSDLILAFDMLKEKAREDESLRKIADRFDEPISYLRRRMSRISSKHRETNIF
ncbi:TIR domain-containing protein [Morganella morganii]